MSAGYQVRFRIADVSALRATEHVENTLNAAESTFRRELEVSDELRNRHRAANLALANFHSGAQSLSVVPAIQLEEFLSYNDFIDSQVRHAQAIVGFYRSIGGGCSPTPFTEYPTG
ncbi:MAG: hypothetical protein LKH33_03080 [Acetobacter sp.]|jgi:hypothetical protein|nr:hypothetical protein [Acetobacter sp.]MCH4060115.1 hypothetical protein [Acetobacter sp.]MCH4087055.1 hypothetical protein [Acetobacter sp.]MCI1292875.1 hypothetical protein [Acetobacter sp.]MCI1319461.1 hypothetical protein [Acetobacter sp.]